MMSAKNVKNQMMMRNEELGIDVRTIEEDGRILFCGSDAAKALGYAKPNNAINTHCKGATLKQGIIDNLGREQSMTFITEGDLYRLITNSKLPTAEKFESWVFDEILPSIRMNGMYISDTATDEQKQYNFKMLDVTFKNCSVELLEDKYKECMDYHTENKTRLPYKANSKKRSDATHTHNDSKIMVMKRIEKSLENRMSGLITDNRFGLVSEINNVVKLIKDDITKQNNMSNRGKIAGKTKQIKTLMEQVG